LSHILRIRRSLSRPIDTKRSSRNSI
jgi:hypothetical protein